MAFEVLRDVDRRAARGGEHKEDDDGEVPGHRGRFYRSVRFSPGVPFRIASEVPPAAERQVGCVAEGAGKTTSAAEFVWIFSPRARNVKACFRWTRDPRA